MTDASGPGSHVLVQNFIVPGPGTVTLTFQYFRLNQAQSQPFYFSQNTLDYNTNNEPPDFNPNQQARVEILAAGASPFATDATDVQTVFQTNPGDPTMDSSYHQFPSTDISSVVGNGGTFQLRFAEVDDQGFFSFGVDDVSIDYTASTPTVPEPRYLCLLIIAALALALGDAIRRSANKSIEELMSQDD
jgi:hypothetical protein